MTLESYSVNVATDEELPDGFITLPPGIADSITIPEAGPRTERPKAEEIVFFTDPGPAAVPIAGPCAPRIVEPVWQLHLPDGSVVPLSGTVLLGRNPGADARFPGAQLIPVPDPSKSMSKTHAALELTDDGLWVHDLDSTNGVWAVEAGTASDPDGDVTEVRPGLRTQVRPGWTVELGSVAVRLTLDPGGVA